jgi:hypothetical protein
MADPTVLTMSFPSWMTRMFEGPFPPNHSHALPSSSMKALGSKIHMPGGGLTPGVLASIRARPRVSMNGPVGLLATATPMLPPLLP